MLNLLYNNRLDVEVKGKEKLKITLRVSYLKYQKKDWAFCGRKVIIGFLDKVRKDFEKDREMRVLN